MKSRNYLIPFPDNNNWSRSEFIRDLLGRSFKTEQFIDSVRQQVKHSFVRRILPQNRKSPSEKRNEVKRICKAAVKLSQLLDPLVGWKGKTVHEALEKDVDLSVLLDSESESYLEHLQVLLQKFTESCNSLLEDTRLMGTGWEREIQRDFDREVLVAYIEAFDQYPPVTLGGAYCKILSVLSKDVRFSSTNFYERARKSIECDKSERADEEIEFLSKRKIKHPRSHTNS